MTKHHWHGAYSMPEGRAVVVLTVTGKVRLASRSRYDISKVDKARKLFKTHCWNRTPGMTGDLMAIAWSDDVAHFFPQHASASPRKSERAA